MPPDAAEIVASGAVSVWTTRARGVGLLVGFAVAFAMSYREQLPLADCALRGIIGALVFALVCWWTALLVIQAFMRNALARQNAEFAAATAEATAAAEAEMARYMNQSTAPSTPTQDFDPSGTGS
jgi:hypothetical protein